MPEKLGAVPECARCESKLRCSILNKAECPRVRLERLVEEREQKGDMSTQKGGKKWLQNPKYDT